MIFIAGLAFPQTADPVNASKMAIITTRQPRRVHFSLLKVIQDREDLQPGTPLD